MCLSRAVARACALVTLLLSLASDGAQAEQLSKTPFDATYANAQLGSSVRMLYNGDRYVRTITTYGGKLKSVLRDNQCFFDLKLKTSSLLNSGPNAHLISTPFSHFSLIRQFFLDWQQDPPVANAKPLGTQDIDGHLCHGWAVQLACPMDIWVDAQTGSVVREVDHAAIGDVTTVQTSYTPIKYGIEAYTGKKPK